MLQVRFCVMFICACIRFKNIPITYRIIIFFTKKTFWVFFLLACAIASPIFSPMTTWIRIPQHDSAIIQSDRLGGNFAYSTIEGHAYAAINPIIENIHTPVAVNYDAHPLVAPVHIPLPTFQ